MTDNELIESLADAIRKAPLSKTKRHEVMQAEAAISTLKQSGYVNIDELIEKAEKEFSDVGKCGALVGVADWLKSIKDKG